MLDPHSASPARGRCRSTRCRRPRPVRQLLAGLLPPVMMPTLIALAMLLQTSVASAQSSSGTLDPKTPYQAFEDGRYEDALAGFTELQVRYPEDPEVLLNLAATHYELQRYEDADRYFRRAAAGGDESQQASDETRDLRARALYGLGNSAYRQGQLEKAVEHFQKALEMNPDDEDAKFNLEFVRDEIRRRHEENQQRQQNQDQQQDQDQDQQNQDQQGQDSENQDQQGQDQQNQDQQGQQQEDSQGQQPSDRDGDGIPDDTESRGTNPTDPDNPDSDGDGLSDGEEDADRDGRRDPQETDPNNPDSDGDGIPDGQDPTPSPEDGPPEEPENEDSTDAESSPQDQNQDGQNQDGQEQGSAAQAQAAGEGTPEGLTPEEAARYLLGLEEGRPQRKAPPSDRRGQPAKDW